jgi:hypothetical protein
MLPVVVAGAPKRLPVVLNSEAEVVLGVASLFKAAPKMPLDGVLRVDWEVVVVPPNIGAVVVVALPNIGAVVVVPPNIWGAVVVVPPNVGVIVGLLPNIGVVVGAVVAPPNIGVVEVVVAAPNIGVVVLVVPPNVGAVVVPPNIGVVGVVVAAPNIGVVVVVEPPNAGVVVPEPNIGFPNKLVPKIPPLLVAPALVVIVAEDPKILGVEDEEVRCVPPTENTDETEVPDSFLLKSVGVWKKLLLDFDPNALVVVEGETKAAFDELALDNKGEELNPLPVSLGVTKSDGLLRRPFSVVAGAAETSGPDLKLNTSSLGVVKTDPSPLGVEKTELELDEELREPAVKI